MTPLITKFQGQDQDVHKAQNPEIPTEAVSQGDAKDATTTKAHSEAWWQGETPSLTHKFVHRNPMMFPLSIGFRLPPREEAEGPTTASVNTNTTSNPNWLSPGMVVWKPEPPSEPEYPEDMPHKERRRLDDEKFKKEQLEEARKYKEDYGGDLMKERLAEREKGEMGLPRTRRERQEAAIRVLDSHELTMWHALQNDEDTITTKRRFEALASSAIYTGPRKTYMLHNLADPRPFEIQNGLLADPATGRLAPAGRMWNPPYIFHTSVTDAFRAVPWVQGKTALIKLGEKLPVIDIIEVNGGWGVLGLDAEGNVKGVLAEEVGAGVGDVGEEFGGVGDGRKNLVVKGTRVEEWDLEWDLAEAEVEMMVV